jgi:hypothetical protein
MRDETQMGLMSIATLAIFAKKVKPEVRLTARYRLASATINKQIRSVFTALAHSVAGALACEESGLITAIRTVGYWTL